MENWKDISEKEKWDFKVGLVTMFSNELGNINVRYHVGFFEHICYQGHIYLFWLLRQGVCD
jgi:hypothetical protein